MEIYERIRHLRERLNLKTRPFSEKIGYSQGTLSQIEQGKVKVERRLIVVICSVFRVREAWLLTGEGDMFQPPEEMEESALLAILREKYAMTEEVVYLVKGFLKLTAGDKSTLSQIVHKMANPEPESTPAPQKNPSEMVPEAENLRKIG